MTETLDIEKFNPAKTEIAAVVMEAQGLTIKGVDDVAGYTKVHEVRMKLRKMRVQIAATGKSMRSEALAFQKQVIEKEKEYIALIEPTEADLEAKETAIDREKEIAKRLELLPARKENLAKIGVLDTTDASILDMDNEQFTTFLNDLKQIYLTKKEEKLLADQQEVEAEKNRIAEEEKRKTEIEQARKEGEEKAKLEAEERVAREKKEVEERIAREKQESEAKIEREKKEVEAKLQADKEAAEAEQKRVESVKQYQDFLAKNGWTPETKDQFKIERTGNNVVLYKKVAELTL